MQRFALPKWIIIVYQISIWTVGFVVAIFGSYFTTPVLVNIVTESIDTNDPPLNWTYCASYSHDEDAMIFNMIMFIYSIFVSLMNLIIWFLFINRFYVIIGTTQNATFDDTNSIIHIMKKQTLLVGIATTSTIILWLIAFNVPYTFWVFLSDLYITEMCVFLSFGSFEKYYKCLKCHIYENKCCKCVDNIIDNKLHSQQAIKQDPQQT